MTSRRLHRTAGLVCLFLGAPLLLAQAPSPGQPAPRPAGQPPIRTGVNLVRVDVYPSKDGAPVMDLRAEDFEVFEDGAPQRLESFEHVVVRSAGPQEDRIEPNSQRESLQAAADPRNRVFVIFLDTPHVMVDSAHHINEPLIGLVDRILGPDDLVGVMTPAMAANQITLGRKTQVINESLRRNWPWGTRFGLMLDDLEEKYVGCYPPVLYGDLAAEMIHRKRERATLEALQDLVRYLHGIREERKAILTISEGWLLLRENRDMMNLRGSEPVPGREPIGVGPTGQPTTAAKDPRVNRGYMSKAECDTDRMRLAMYDNEQFFRDILDDANRANASFYPIDPRGLPAFDTPIFAALPLLLDKAHLKARQDAMEEMALNTDGIAVMNNNDLTRGLKRIADDLTSYYLLGYYSTNTKLDGRFRGIRVRVKRPGVDIRARRGYRAATVEEATSARSGSTLAGPASNAAFAAAMGSLGRIRPDARFRINAAASAAAGTLWVAGEVLQAPPEPDTGANADIEVTAGAASATTRVALKPGQRTFLTHLKLEGMSAGPIEVQARVSNAGGTPAVDEIRLELDQDTTRPLLFRRGPATANRVLPAADFRFSRMERLRIEVPVGPGSKPGSAQLLDRMGKPLDIPVSVSERRDEGTGQLWIVGDVALAPLAPGDYGVEVAFTTPAGEQRVITAIRVTR
ncbi:MAG TPA: VWA domain-containing protein [Vicinamibacterales bacterium]|nr:VWA domain-containing protein [Vicinamibacterales bacterium]